MTKARKVAIGLVVLDVIAVALAFNVVAWLWVPAMLQANGPILLQLALPVILLGVSLYLIDGYKLNTDMLSLDYASVHCIALLSAMAITLLVTFAIIPGGYELQQSRSVIGLSFVALIPLTLMYRRIFYERFLRTRRQRSIVFIGDPQSARDFQSECRNARMEQPIVYARSRDAAPAGPASSPDEPDLVPFAALLPRISSGELGVEAIVLRESSRDLSDEISQKLVDLYFGGIPTYTLELFHQVYWRKIPLYRLNQTWLFQEGFRVAREPVFERLKRVSDVLLSLLMLIAFLPLLLVAAAAIWVDDRGPVLFRQTRIGKFNTPFRMLKLRTMRSGAPGGVYAQPGDNRVTAVGRLLRATRLDEVPQLVNVLRGDMSLIGPRAEWDRLVADYERQIPCYHFRHLVRPGITGWAQVNYPYGGSVDDTLRKLEYDLYYIRHFSFVLDASIVLKTVHVMLFGKGR